MWWVLVFQVAHKTGSLNPPCPTNCGESGWWQNARLFWSVAEQYLSASRQYTGCVTLRPGFADPKNIPRQVRRSKGAATLSRNTPRHLTQSFSEEEHADWAKSPRHPELCRGERGWLGFQRHSDGWLVAHSGINQSKSSEWEKRSVTQRNKSVPVNWKH